MSKKMAKKAVKISAKNGNITIATYFGDTKPLKDMLKTGEKK